VRAYLDGLQASDLEAKFRELGLLMLQRQIEKKLP
jgi:hypothetical protein